MGMYRVSLQTFASGAVVKIISCPPESTYSRILRHELPLPIVEGLLDS